jgi:hypothetical protein
LITIQSHDLIVGELIPMRLAPRIPGKMASAVAAPMKWNLDATRA